MAADLRSDKYAFLRMEGESRRASLDSDRIGFRKV